MRVLTKTNLRKETMLKDANKIMATVVYKHTPPKCRKSRTDCIRAFGDDAEEARVLINKEALEVLKKSKNVSFRSIIYQPAKVDGFSTTFMGIPTIGLDGCFSGTLDILELLNA